MSANSAGKKVLVLSDNSGLARVVEVNLSNQLNMQVIRSTSSTWRCDKTVDIDNFDLLVLAISSSVNEPVVALARASLTETIGRIPLLIISDRPFESEPEDQIEHLDFPFDVNTLRQKVDEILYRSTCRPSPNNL